MTGIIQDIDQKIGSIQEVERLSVVASKIDNLIIITGAQERIEWVNNEIIPIKHDPSALAGL